MVIAADNIRIERFSFVSFAEGTTRDSDAAIPAHTQEETSEEIADAPPPAPVFSEEQLEAARAESYKEGFAEGKMSAETEQKKAEALRDEAVRNLLEVIANRITLAAEAHGTLLEKQRSSLHPLVLSIARKIAGVALHHDAYAPLEALLHECSALVISEPSLTLVVSPEFAEPLEKRMDTLREFLVGFEGKIEVKSDPSVHEHDCRVEWQRGFMEHNTEKLWADIEALLTPTTEAEG